jgi:hypothetical protein
MEVADRGFLDVVLAFWDTPDVSALAELGARGFIADRQERNYRFGKLGTMITAAAEQGVSVACAVRDQAATTLGIGIRLVGACFPGAPVPVALVGSVVRWRYLERAVRQVLARRANRNYHVVEPALTDACPNSRSLIRRLEDVQQ